MCSIKEVSCLKISWEINLTFYLWKPRSGQEYSTVSNAWHVIYWDREQDLLGGFPILSVVESPSSLFFWVDPCFLLLRKPCERSLECSFFRHESHEWAPKTMGFPMVSTCFPPSSLLNPWRRINTQRPSSSDDSSCSSCSFGTDSFRSSSGRTGAPQVSLGSNIDIWWMNFDEFAGNSEMKKPSIFYPHKIVSG